jgi:catechol 2,3-dioxygenase-like lactoylglutathione lyase family enzyme
MRLSDAKVEAVIAVSDMSRAKEFYESKLGLSGGEEQGDGGTRYPCGEGTSVHVYPSPSASASGATLAGWEVDDLDATVDELTSNGVSFERYEQGELKTNEKGIADLGDAKAAWCKDPDGNVVGVLQYTS